jgi:hypothetical protein
MEVLTMSKYVLTAEQKQHQINCNNVIKIDLVNRISDRLLDLVLENESVPENETEMYKQEYKEQLIEQSHNDNLRYYVGYMIEQGSKKAIKIMKLIIEYNKICKAVIE